jgi:DNA adenine methylase Dam
LSQIDLFGNPTYDTNIHPPFLQYMGNKRRVLKMIRHMIPTDINTLCEPFAGMAVISFNTRANEYHINEFMLPLYSIYKYLSKNDYLTVKCDLMSIISEYNLSTENGYMDFRNNHKNNYDYGLYVLVCSLFARQNLIRVNSTGRCNTSYGHKLFYNINLERIKYYVDYIHNNSFTITNKSFEDLDYTQYTEHDYLYCDPPYAGTNAEYNRDWTDKQEETLYKLLNKLSDKNIRWGYSNILGESPFLNDFIADNTYKVHYLGDDLYTTAGMGFNKPGKKHQEIFITNV